MRVEFNENLSITVRELVGGDLFQDNSTLYMKVVTTSMSGNAIKVSSGVMAPFPPNTRVFPINGATIGKV